MIDSAVHDTSKDRERCTAIVLAAGSGTRMGAAVRKQYLSLCGKPILAYCLETFAASEVITDIVIVVPEGEAEFVRQSVISAAPAAKEKVRKIIPGGEQRYDSVHAGLQAIDWPCEYVFIHDGARPFIEEEALQRLYLAVRAEGAAVAGMPSKDTVKIADRDHFVCSTPDRSCVWIIQTPQVFSLELIRGAYEKLAGRLLQDRSAGHGVTDDAMVLESETGHKVKLIEASYRNIKITTPEDLLIAEAFLKS
ncbi:MAG: 2-C-methyl-D-erythritol 4-phosphate cytidylyltransferase [Lachnospiraceae bacterium]|nr:2-C-methyl-D-erythritol 4-phosphate cytidylyltransferase [Lachnospiraceae bacterium]